MPRYKLILEYEGTSYSGWQRQQAGVASIQESVERAILAFSREEASVHACGRTDAGVHAYGQVAHVTLTKDWTPFRLMEAVNFYLKPQPIAILAASLAPEDWHARFACLRRWYSYRILCRRAPPTLAKGRVWALSHPLDVEAMQAGAARLLGKHDFSSFRASLCQAHSPIRTLDRLDVQRFDDEIRITAAARSFLHHQVRNMAGTLVLVGQGKWFPNDVSRALKARDRAAAGPTAPAGGLYFMRADYP